MILLSARRGTTTTGSVHSNTALDSKERELSSCSFPLTCNKRSNLPLAMLCRYTPPGLSPHSVGLDIGLFLFLVVHFGIVQEQIGAILVFYAVDRMKWQHFSFSS